MNININNSWKEILTSEFQKEYFTKLSSFVSDAYQGSKCYPDLKDIFSAFNYCDFNNVKELGMTGDDGNYGPMLALPDEETEAKLTKINASIQAKEDELQLTKKQLTAQGTFIKQLISNTACRIFY